MRRFWKGYASPAPVNGTIPITVWMLGIVSLLMDVSTEMINALLPLYLASSLGVSAFTIGIIEGLSVAIATAAKSLSGIFADWGRRAKPLAVVGYGLAALSRLIFPLAVSLDQIVIAKALDRIGKGVRGAPRDAIVAAVTPPEIRGASFGLRKSLDTVGGFAGPLIAIGTLLIFSADITTVFWLAVIPASLAVFVLVVFVREPDDRQRDSHDSFHLPDALKLNRAIWAVIALAGLIMLARFSEAFILLKSLEAGFVPAWVPLSLVVMHAFYGLAAWPVGAVSDRIGTTGLLIVGLCFLMGAHLTLAFAETAWVYILGTVLWGLHMGFSQGLLGAMIASVTPNHIKGSAFGTFNLVAGGVVLVSNTAAGWFWHSIGSYTPFLIGAVLSAIAVVCIALKRRELQC